MSQVGMPHTACGSDGGDLYAYVMNDGLPPVTFGDLIRTAREALGWSQEQLEQATADLGERVSISTISRWERGQAGRPEPAHVRVVCKALGIDPRRAAVALGYLTADEVEGRPQLRPEVEEILAILEDPTLPQDDREKWVEYLRFLYQRAQRHAS